MTLVDKYGEWAFVAGSSEGLGAAFAEQAASRGFNIILLARRLHLLEQVAANLRDTYGVKVRIICVDLADPDCAEQILPVCDELDIGLFIYNAAAEPQGIYTDIRIEDHIRNIAVNCTTPTILSHHIGRSMIARGRGCIVLVGSMGGEQGIARFVSYGAAKSYEIILGEGLWYEMREFGVEAFTYVVGATATPKFIERMKDFINEDGSSRLNVSEEHKGSNLNQPRSPEQVAARLFESFGKGPRCYSHPEDEAKTEGNRMKTRKQLVNEMSNITAAAYTTVAGD